MHRTIGTIRAALLAILVVPALVFAQTTNPATAPADVDPPPGVVRVACVGDSITYGQNIKDRAHDSYPAKVGAALGPGFAVRNYGVNGTTALHDGDRPYVLRPVYPKAIAFKPDVLIVALGTNDTKPQNWNHGDAFVADYEAIVAAFKKANPAVKVYVVLPPPCFLTGDTSIRDSVLENEVVPKVKQIAADENATTIDVRAALKGHADWFPDKIHPNETGAAVYAETVTKALKDQK